jgi:CheY-like chemotaxis protein
LILKSRKGEGTTAEIWLRVATEVPETACDEAEEVAPEPTRRALRVLAVDDDPLVLFNTTAMLEDLGHTALEANSGAEALDLLRRHPVDLVITDQAMPKMTGVQLLEAVRAEWPDLPVVLATGYAELPGGLASRAPKLQKPFMESDLADLLATL